MTALRFHVSPRDVPAICAARRLGLTLAQFEEVKDRLFSRGFPKPDPDTGFYDLKAIDSWQDRRSGLTVIAGGAQDARDIVAKRLAGEIKGWER